MLREIIQRLLDDVTGGLKHDAEVYADKLLRRMMRTLLLGGLGVTFLAAGSVFVLLGVVAYLSTLMSSGLAWGVVGLVVALVGGALLFSLRR